MRLEQRENTENLSKKEKKIWEKESRKRNREKVGEEETK